jgi:DNA polymerase-3 subunit alpha
LTNTSKLREFVEELKRLKIDIIRPSINKCFAEFKAEKNKIYYGLGAIKSVGFEAISNIIKEREKNGEFKSMVDFVNRVDSRDVNKLQLEGLVKSGVFDEFDLDRNKILNSIPKIIQKIKNINDDKLNNQSNLFSDNSNEKNDFDYVKSTIWTKKELLSEEFKSLGFYISDHPLNEFTEIFEQLKITTYKEFLQNNESEALVAGTIMSIQEKKSAKGTPFAIVKFSDNRGEFELFLFADILVNNRDKIKESESFALTLQKDRLITDVSKRRINLKKILNLDDIINKPYSKVTIELKENYNIEEIKNLLKTEGQTEISLIINKKNQRIHYSLQNARKFDFNQLKAMKNKEYVKKITV